MQGGACPSLEVLRLAHCGKSTWDDALRLQGLADSECVLSGRRAQGCMLRVLLASHLLAGARAGFAALAVLTAAGWSLDSNCLAGQGRLFCLLLQLRLGPVCACPLPLGL